MADPVCLQSRDEYTVGWIAALHFELAAALAMLDEEHDTPADFDQPRTDPNTYSYGRIGKHNVVIGILPSGNYGTTPAATTASHMVSSFPNVKIGLMVGIGAGLPRKESDVRLGDVVVSSPEAQHGGVLQYDLGKAKGDDVWEPKGFLSPPPQVLLTAVNKIRAKHDLGNSNVSHFLRVFSPETPAGRRFSRPEALNDRLFNSSYTHVGDSDCSQCDTSKEVSRQSRDDPMAPEIHYGTIASGNTLLKDVLQRDEVAQRIPGGCICFEMEAAGLMNNFPCLVVRGICDYADSHKNDKWQRYAAAVAAAYAKDLLGYVSVQTLQHTRNAGEVVHKIAGNVDEIRKVTEKMDQENTHDQIKAWLSPPDPSVNYNNAAEKRSADSGRWFLDSPEFLHWKKNAPSTLWLYGIPGCGKTFLSCAIIEELLKASSTSAGVVLYFFFDFSDTTKQCFEKMIRSLTYQLSGSSCANFEEKCLKDFFEKHGNANRQPSVQSLCNVFQSMMENVSQPIFIVLDAIDECTTRKPFLEWANKVDYRILMTSRELGDIKSSLGASVTKYDLSIQKELSNKDIQAYVHQQLHDPQTSTLARMWESRQDILDNIERSIAERSNGMFRWATCQLAALEEHIVPHRLLKALESLPRTLQETYKHILEKIPEHHREDATRLFQFLVYSKRPLTIEEVVDVLAITPRDDPKFDENNRMPDSNRILDICSSLVTIITETIYSGGIRRDIHYLRLAHYSVKEYLISSEDKGFLTEHLDELESQSAITKVILHYMSCWTTNWWPYKFHLRNYCASYWMDHARDAEQSSESVRQQIINFLSHETIQSNAHFWIFNIDKPDEKGLFTQRRGTALYYATVGGLQCTVEKLISQKPNDLNTIGGRYGTALQAACENRRIHIAKLFLNHGADVDPVYEKSYTAGCTPLMAALLNGLVDLAHLLLDQGADCNARGYAFIEEWGSHVEVQPLQIAALQGFEDLTERLLRIGAEIDGFIDCECSPLILASARGHERIVHLLLQEGANVNAQTGENKTALFLAVLNGHEEVVRLLLQEGAEVNARTSANETALFPAVSKGREELVRLLTQWGADLDVRNCGNHTALIESTCSGNREIARLLLEGKPAMNIRNDHYDTALENAIYRRDKEMLRLLLQYRTAEDAQNDGGITLSAAVRLGDEDLVQIVLAYGANPNSYDSEDDSPLDIAFEHGAESMVLRLIKKGATRFLGDKSLFRAACADGYAKVVTVLLDNDAHSCTSQGESCGCLEIAAWYGHENVAEILLDRGFPVDAAGDYGGALLAASHEGHVDVIDILLRFEADTTRVDKHGWPAFLIAKSCGHTDVVERLRPEAPLTLPLFNCQMPSAMTTAKRRDISICPRGTEVTFRGGAYSEGGVQANHPFHATARVPYFEAVILELNPSGIIYVGLSTREGDSPFDFTGYDNGEWAVDSNGGRFLDGRYDDREDNRSAFCTGDTIGYGIDYNRDAVFITKNGVSLGRFSGASMGRVFACIGFSKGDAKVQVKFNPKLPEDLKI